MNKSSIFNFIGVRFKAAALLLIYILCFDWMYKYWLSPAYEYMGFEYHKVGAVIFFVSHIVAWLPIWIAPLKLKRPSILMYWFLFLMTYIPAVLLPVYIQLSNQSDIYLLLVSLLAGMLIISIIYYIPLVKINGIAIGQKRFLGFLYFIALVLVIYVLIIYRNNIRLVGLDDIYDLRSDNDDLLKQNALAGYAILELGTCIFPFFLAWGCLKKNYFLVVASTLGQIFLYSTGGAKTYLFASLIMVLIFFTIRKNQSGFSVKILYSFILLIAVLTTALLYCPDSWLILTGTVASILFMRTICMGGMLTAQYYAFFNSHPKTYYSHINIIGKILTNPYGNTPLGRVIGYEFTGNDLLNSNANFWATDGLAASGIAGILIVSILCGLTFWLFDSFAAKHNIVFTTLCTVVITMGLLNTSLFTTILSGGLGLMIIFFYFMQKTNTN